MRDSDELMKWCRDNFPDSNDQMTAFRALQLLYRPEWPGNSRVMDILQTRWASTFNSNWRETGDPRIKAE